MKIKATFFTLLVLVLSCRLRGGSTSNILEAEGAKSEKFVPDYNSPAWKDFQSLKNSGDQANAQLIEKVAQGTVSIWLTNSDINATVQTVKNRLAEVGKESGTAVFVVYNIPNRDCGSYSGGGASNYGAYQAWLGAIAKAIGDAPAFVIFEPDTLPQSCMRPWDEVKKAVLSIKNGTKARVYIDMGHAKWKSVDEAAMLLGMAGIESADGFSLNVSNFIDDQTSIKYGQDIKAKVKKNFVIDSSRNGKGSGPGMGEDQWCNPPGRGLGKMPSTATGVEGLDAYLWIKNPGESDGTCRGNPPAGQYKRELALELARNANSGGSMSEDKPKQTATSTPTAKPSSSPTSKPSSKPTTKPTTKPTDMPTDMPMPEPTEPEAPQGGDNSPEMEPNPSQDMLVKVEFLNDGNNAAEPCWRLKFTNNSGAPFKMWRYAFSRETNDPITTEMLNFEDGFVTPSGTDNQEIEDGASKVVGKFCTFGKIKFSKLYWSE